MARLATDMAAPILRGGARAMGPLTGATRQRRMSRRQLVSWAVRGLAASEVGALLSACAPTSTGTGKTPTGRLTIAYQFGLGYAQLVLAKQGKWLEALLPGMDITYKLLPSGAAVRDAMLAGEVQIGSGAPGPFLVGWDAGIGWKLLSSLDDMDLWLMAKDPRIRGLKDFAPKDRIAVVSPDSIQAITLRKAAQRDLGNAHALDTNMVTLAHPDGLQALLSGQVAAHLTSPPFQFQEQDAGARRILGSYDLFGPSTFVAISVLATYHDANPAVMDALSRTIKRGTEMIAANPDQTAPILAADAGAGATAEQYLKWLTAPGIMYTTVPHGYAALAAFMKDSGMIKKAPGSWQDLVFDNLKQEKGS
jgi:NitT/TauT family transport system substrate-binding protein